jgi:hypothetical protein
MERVTKFLKTDDILQYSCPICLNLTVEPVHLVCTHTFCSVCLNEMIENFPCEKEFSCPMCRKMINKDCKIVIDIEMENYLKENFAIEYKQRIEQLIKYKNSQKNILKLKIVYGNTHQEVTNPKRSRSDKEKTNSHKWSCFVKIENGQTKNYIRKVVFGMHPSFGATQIEVKAFPFQITRIGWGTFNIPITIHWHKNIKIQNPLVLEYELSFNANGETKVHILKIPIN